MIQLCQQVVATTGSSLLEFAEDTPIGYSTLYLQRREDLYPIDMPHPHEFIPERWGEMDPQNLAVHSVQRRFKDMHWSTFCTDRDE